MRKYEVMFILPADADDAAVKGAVERISKVIGEAGGEVTKTDTWGRRRLAYEIGKHADGFYVVAEMTADPGSIRELERVLHLADEIIRFKVTVTPPPRVPRIGAKARAAEAASSGGSSGSGEDRPASVPAGAESVEQAANPRPVAEAVEAP